MNKEIMNKLKEEIIAEVGHDCEITFQEARKNNGVTRQGVIIRESGAFVAPRIYIDKL